MKKLLARAMVIAILVGCVGCTAKQASKPEEEIPTLTWYVHGDNQSDIQSVIIAANKIAEEQIGARVSLSFISQGAYNERMATKMAAGENFDLCFTGYVNNYKNAVNRGGLLKLDEYIKNSPELMEAIPGYVWKSLTIDDGIYAVPNMQILAFQLNAYTFRDLADKYGLAELEPQKIQDWEPYFEQIKKNEPDYIPFRNNWSTGVFLDTRIKEGISSGINAFWNGDGTFDIENLYGTAHYKEAVEQLNDWYKKGYIRSDIASVIDDAQDHSMGRYAVWVEKYKPGIVDELSERYGREIVTYPITPCYMPANYPDAMTGVSKTTKHPAKSVALLKLLNTNKEFYNLFAFGVEGRHYDLDANNRVVYRENSGYAPKAAWKFGNQFNALLVPGQPEDVWQETMAMNDNALRSPLMGFVFDTNPVRNEIAQVATIISEYKTLGTGAEAPGSQLDEMNLRLRSAGQKKIEEEINRQIQEWKEGGR